MAREKHFKKSWQNFDIMKVYALVFCREMSILICTCTCTKVCCVFQCSLVRQMQLMSKPKSPVNMQNSKPQGSWITIDKRGILSSRLTYIPYTFTCSQLNLVYLFMKKLLKGAKASNIFKQCVLFSFDIVCIGSS